MTTLNDSPANGPTVADTARRGQASWRTTVAAGFLGLALVGGSVAALSGEDASDPVPPAASTDTTQGSADELVETQPDTTTTTASSAEVPGDVTWELVSGRAVPSSPTAGPTKVNGPVHAGYAHTPAGAVLAALNISARYVFTPSDGWLKVTKVQVEPGKSREAFVKSRTALGAPTRPEGGWAQTAGFRISSYTANRAVIDEAVAFSSGALQTRTLTVVWRGGDWRLVLESDGDPSPAIAPLGDLSGFVAFSGGIL